MSKVAAAPEEVLARYMPQLQHNMAVKGCELSLMSVIYGNERPKDVIRRIEQANRSQEQPEPDQSESAEGSGCAKPPKRVLDPAAERNRRCDHGGEDEKDLHEADGGQDGTRDDQSGKGHRQLDIALTGSVLEEWPQQRQRTD